jgi:hypothetical protein
MIPIYPDLEWCSSISERKGISTRCPHATVHRCHRYFESLSLLSEQGITTKMDQAIHDQLLKKWEAHELWPVTDEGATSISGGKVPNCFSNFCPEVTFDTFKLFASTVIRFYDEIDSDFRHKALAAETIRSSKDWRWNFEHVASMHYSDCPIYSKILKEKVMPQVTIHGNVNGQVNIGGESVNSPVLQLSIGELLARIDAADASPGEKVAAKSKLQELLAHPVVAAIVGGLAGRIGA